MEGNDFQQLLQKCRTVVISRIERGIKNAIFYRYIRQNRLENVILKYTINQVSNVIIQFRTHKDALKFYNEGNFREKILLRPFNISFKLQIPANVQHQKTGFKVEGLKDSNIRQVFEVSRKIGLCRFIIDYQNNKLKSEGQLSFIRKHPLSEDQFKGFKDELEKIQVKITLQQLEEESIQEVKNSYKILFANGLQNIFESVDQMNEEFTKVLKLVNPNVERAQVSAKGYAYSAIIYLKQEEDGKEFLTTYNQHRSDLVDFFLNKKINFNIYIDFKTINKNKAIQKRMAQISKNIKNEKQKEATDKAKNYPYQRYNQPMQQTYPYQRYNQPIQQIKDQQLPKKSDNKQHRMFQQNKKPFKYIQRPPIQILSPSIYLAQKEYQQNKKKIQRFIERKELLINECKADKNYEQNIKRQLFPLVSYILKKDLCEQMSQKQISATAQNMLERSPIQLIISFMQKPHDNLDLIRNNSK